nr:immunoglobulin light chain junction region [Macaca mulatta]
RAVGHTSGRLF